MCIDWGFLQERQRINWVELFTQAQRRGPILHWKLPPLGYLWWQSCIYLLSLWFYAIGALGNIQLILGSSSIQCGRSALFIFFWRMGIGYSLLLFHRTPFEPNTASRCAIIVLFEDLVNACMMYVICTLTCLFIGSMIYVGGCLLDIKSIFRQVDGLSKCENAEFEMSECCKDAANRYFMHFSNVLHLFEPFLYLLCPDSCISWQMSQMGSFSWWSHHIKCAYVLACSR